MFTKLISRAYNASPKQWVARIRRGLGTPNPDGYDYVKATEIEQFLQQHFDRYKTSNLVGISPQEFRSFIESKLGTENLESEGYSKEEIERQRDFSIKFTWGHNHDFGDFSLTGKMKNSHIWVLAHFLSLFPVSIESFKGKDVLDIGCWTGGTSLLLAALGGRVVAIEEVNKYAQMASFLAKSFGIEKNMQVVSTSLYDLDAEEFYDRFDLVYIPGVIYHLSDPLIAARILFNACKIGGMILVESAGIDRDEPVCLFEGSYEYHSGEKKHRNRAGWNWFLPSQSALHRILKEAGFDEIQTLYFRKRRRVYGYAKKTSQVGICRAGLSVPGIR